MLPQVALFHSFQWLSHIPLCICVCVCVCVCVFAYTYVFHIFFIQFSASGQLGCFCVLAVVNSAAVNFGVRVPFIYF